MSWIPRAYNSYPVKTIQTATFFYNAHEAYKNKEAVVPSQRVARIVTDVVRRSVFKGLPPLR